MSEETKNDQLPKATKTPKGPRSRASRELRLNELRRLLRLRLRQPEIAQHLNISDRTLRDDLKLIAEQDRQWLSELGRESFVSELRGAFEFLKDRERKLLVIEQDETVSPWTRTQASLGLVSIEMQAVELLKDGPLILSLRGQVDLIESKISEARRSQPAADSSRISH
jgi:hypothetical protein